MLLAYQKKKKLCIFLEQLLAKKHGKKNQSAHPVLGLHNKSEAHKVLATLNTGIQAVPLPSWNIYEKDLKKTLKWGGVMKTHMEKQLFFTE